MSELKKEPGMCSDFCAKWSDDEYRLYLNTLKERKIAYCEEHGIPIPLFDKAEDYFVPWKRSASEDFEKRKKDNANGWIRVKDRLPEDGTRALVFCEDGATRIDMIIQDEFRPFINRGGMVVSVTHWMPLPPPPEKTAL